MKTVTELTISNQTGVTGLEAKDSILHWLAPRHPVLHQFRKVLSLSSSSDLASVISCFVTSACAVYSTPYLQKHLHHLLSLPKSLCAYSTSPSMSGCRFLCPPAHSFQFLFPSICQCHKHSQMPSRGTQSAFLQSVHYLNGLLLRHSSSKSSS